MKTHWFQRTLCSVLAFILVLGYIPATAFASEEDGLCEHHPEHTEACGYSAAVEEHDCNHAHTEECYQTVTACVHTHDDCGYIPAVEGQSCECQPDENGEIVHTEGCGYVEAVAEVPCGHVCSVESGCITDALNCQHQHDGECGYVEAVQESACTFQCAECEKDSAAAMKLEDASTYSASSGTCGENLTWTLEDRVLTISGSGDMTDYDSDNPAPWYELELHLQIDSAVINEGVTSIGNSAFSGCKSMTSITVPNSVTSIGFDAFSGCVSLTGITIPAGVTSIEDYTFFYCGRLTDITIPNSVTSIGESVFSGCAKLTEITIPVSVTSIGCDTFSDCMSLTSISIPDKVTSIGDYTFFGCGSLSSVTIPAGVTSIGEGAFCNCDGLKDVYYGGTEEQWSQITIGDENSALENTTVHYTESDNTAVDSGTCGDELTWTLEGGTLTISGTGEMDGMVAQNVECVGPWKAHQSGIQSVVIEEGVTSIGAMCFTYCTNLESVTIPGTVERIDPYAFFGTGLKQVSIPAIVREIGHAAFSNCSALERIDVAADNVNYCSIDGVLYDKDRKDLLVYPAAKPEASFTIPDSVAYIDDWACIFAQFTEVILPQGLSGIGLEAFASCANLEEISIPAGVSAIRNGAFTNCGSLTEITFSHSADDTLAIGENAFRLTSETATKIVVPHKDMVHKAISGYDWAGSKRSVTYGSLLEASSILLTQGDTVLNGPLDLDMAESTTLTLSAEVQPASAPQTVTWSSDNETVAAVDADGVVTLKKPGSAVITATATDGSGVTANVTLNIIYLDAAETLSASADVPEIGLQPGQTAQMTVTGTAAISAEKLRFASSNESIATVDESGTITAGTTPGTATITASLKDDPLNRSASVTVEVIPPQTASLTLLVDDKEVTELVRSVSISSQSFSLNASALDADGNSLTPGVTWSSSNSAIAEVTVAQDGAVTLTIPAKAEGQCVITATANDLSKTSARLTVCVWDFSPRLASGSITLNSYSQQGVVLDLRESYGNKITGVQLSEYDRNQKAYVPSARFSAELEDSALIIGSKGTVKNGTYKNVRLDVTCEDGVTYPPYYLQVKVKNSLPAVTVKQTEKFNLFYRDSTANLSITAPGQTITDVELANTDNFTVTYEDGTATLHYNNIPAGSPDTKGTLLVYLEGYRLPVSKSITISTYTGAPKLTLTPSTTTVRQAEDVVVTLQVLDAQGGPMRVSDDQGNPNITCTASFADVTTGENTLALKLTKTNTRGIYTGGYAYVKVQLDGWTKSVTLKCKVSVSTKAPSLKLGATTLTLNRSFTERTAQTPVTLDQKNLALQGVTVTSAARAGSSAAVEAAKLDVTYANGIITAKIRPNTVPKAGTYSYSCTGTTRNGETTYRTTLKVTVSDAPKVKLLSSSSVKLNKYLAGKEAVNLRVSVPSGYTLMGFQSSREDIIVENGALKLTDSATVGKHTLYLYPKLKDNSTDQVVKLNAYLKLTVQVYESSSLRVSLSAKGSLNTLYPGNAITYTSKLTNCVGTITGVRLDGQDKDKFQAEVKDGKIVLKLSGGKSYATNVTYPVQFCVTVNESISIPPTVVNIRVSQSKVKLTASPTTLNLYQSQRVPLAFRLTQSAGEIGSVAISGKTSADLLAALGEDALQAAYNGKTAALKLSIQNTARLKAGKSYYLYLDVTPKNNATNLTATQVKLTVRVKR